MKNRTFTPSSVMKNQSVLFTETQFRLTVLWAFTESALGGFLHAFKLPLTGLLVGGMAILLIGLLAQSTTNPFKLIIKATTLVLLVKAAASPHSPPMAYVAVAFQGITGAAIYAILPYKRGAFFHATLSMAESALQKIIITTLIFGMQLWASVDKVAGELIGIKGDAVQISFWIVGMFTLVHISWGLVLAAWLKVLPQQIEDRKEWYNIENGIYPDFKNTPKKKYLWPLFGVLSMIALSLVIGMAQGSWHNGLLAFARAAVVIVLLIFIIKPLLKVLILKWTTGKAKQNSNQLQNIINELPRTELAFKQVNAIVSSKYKGISYIKELFLGLMATTIYRKTEVE